MRQLITAFVLMTITTHLHAYLNYPDAKALSGGYGKSLTHNRDIATFFTQVDYLPSDLPRVPSKHKYKKFKHYGYKKPSLFGGCKKLCPQRYEPVCGQNKQTYYNLCHALCDGTRLKYIGKCKFSGLFLRNCLKCRRSSGTPVCGSDDVSYPNKCFATCAGVTIKERQCCCGDSTCCIHSVIDFLHRIK